MAARTHILNSGTKAMLLSGTALVRASARERSMGRLMRSPEGHEPAAPAPTPAPAPAPTPAPSPAPAPSAPEPSALGGAGDPPPADPAVPAAPAAPKDPAETPPAEPEAAPEGVPEAYELTAPEGTTLDAEAVAAATPVFKELGLSNEQANKLMPVAAQFAQQIADKLNGQILAQVQADRKAWLDSAKADPEIGGAQWDKTLTEGAAALDRLGFPKGSGFRVLLDESGFGNHPDMIRAWAKVGQAIGDDPKFLRGNGAPAPKRDMAETLYPNDRPKGGQ